MTEEFPWQHAFPPFFTLQPHEQTRVKQLEAWRSMILDYCQSHQITQFDVQEIGQSALFHNKTIQRRLSPEDLLVVLEDLRSHGHLEWDGPAKSRRKAHIYWRRPEEWGSLIYNWAQAHGMTNTVCTLFEITQGDDAQDQAFQGLDQDLLIKALKCLELESKAELFPDQEGVKFF
ncbi:hypothetical protein TCAL_16610 [Tigriopus californicus]|uniref:Vacuolar protein-sorting-associated protein 25 n=1 Tax=Tigriopus californicus TaxID=6832 RepID=A0A553NAR0_TIGCA|nr:vacuolar protein-sorting-associated protein 25-like [Tigriopus californicus]TRY62523.1 hypothetical protein TCAL_16610 [Tigriopus californicus]